MKGPALCSVHTHSTLCDGKNTIPEMADAAYAAGVRYFGASGHSHTNIPWDLGNVLTADYGPYFAQVLAAREKYEGRMEVLLGLELDCCSACCPEGLDYVIASVHNLFDEERGRYYALDWDAEKLQICRDEMFGGSMERLVARYFAQVAAAAQKRPDILGHVDLITKLNGNGEFFDETAPWYQSCALEALEQADPDATLVEINTGAVARGWRRTPYPALFLLRRWRERGGNVIITSDAHSCGHIVFGYAAAAELAAAAGYRESVLLTRRGWACCAL